MNEEEKENGVKIVEKDNNVVEMINDEEDEVEVVKSLSSKEKQEAAKVDEIEIDDDSEEETTETVGAKDLKGGKGRNWYKNNKWK